MFICRRILGWLMFELLLACMYSKYMHLPLLFGRAARRSKERWAQGHSWPTEVQTDKGGSDTWLYQVLTQEQDMQPERRGKRTVKSPRFAGEYAPVHLHEKVAAIYMTVFPKRQYVCALVCVVFVCVCRQLVVLALEIVSRGGWGTESSCEHLFLIETTKLVRRK